MKLLFLCCLIIILQFKIFSQVETVPTDRQIYPFLKSMQNQGVLINYDDIILPLSRSTIQAAFREIESNLFKLSLAEQQLFTKLKEKINDNQQTEIESDGETSSALDYFLSEHQKHLYSFSDTTFSFYIDPILESKFI
ncbi:MAG: hypothetical protein K8H86_04430, partial [Ignavibacteriaceae bacterium]|nr:hypothetical protein [Ignavibacteriaceae bacterium]